MLPSELANLDPDLITVHILADLEPSQLINYVLSSKDTYKKRDTIVKENKYTHNYEGDYFADLLNSHITGFSNGSMIMIIPKTAKLANQLNPVFVTNTYKLIAHSHQAGVSFSPSPYFQELIKVEFGYERNQICEDHFSRIYQTDWWNCNVNIYDIYKIIYHMTLKKHRNLGEALETFSFIRGNRLEIKNSLDVITGVYCPQHPNARALRAITFYLFHSYLEFIKPMIADTSTLADFAKQPSGTDNMTIKYLTLAHRSYQRLGEIKDLPEFIKNKMNKKYMAFFKSFEELLSEV
jgi:hypothetical protein